MLALLVVITLLAILVVLSVFSASSELGMCSMRILPAPAKHHLYQVGRDFCLPPKIKPRGCVRHYLNILVM